jgi:UDP-N-acetyl-2-amino-2-deoxyglucuronate dehydrogenase
MPSLTMKKYNVGIIGYGWAASAHIEAINKTKQGQVTAIYSSRKLDDAELSAKHGTPIKSYQNLDEMLANPDIHVVDISSYPSQHRDQAIAAANAKKHIILEKPMANSLQEVREIVAAAKANGVKGCVCFECRFSNQFEVTKALVDEGLLGSIHYGEVDYYHGIGPWYGQFRWNTGKKDGGSALLTAGCHALDALLMVMGGEVESVTSFSTKTQSEIFKPYDYDTTSVTLIHFKNGAVGKSAAVVDCLQPYYFHTHLCGSQGSLLDDKFHSMKLHTDKHAWSKLSMKMLDSGDVSDHPYETQFQAFFDALDAGKDMPLTSFPEALRSFEVIFASDQSAAQGGKPVRIADLD